MLEWQGTVEDGVNLGHFKFKEVEGAEDFYLRI